MSKPKYVFNGKNPQNARIRINYNGMRKPKVSFSYPLHRKDAFRGTMFFTLFMVWCLLNLPLMMYWIHIQDKFFDDELPYDSIKNYNLSNYSDFLRYYNQPERINESYNTFTMSFFESVKDAFSHRNRNGLYFLLYFFGGFCLLYFPFRKKWDGLFPDYQAFFANKKYKKFTKRDLKVTDEGIYYLELPVFSNILCDFNAVKDFSKHLKEFEIEEYKFQYYRRTRSRHLKKKVRKRNEWYWYARWYFAHKPGTGFLEVKYC